MRYVVDTHALVWYLTQDRRLGSLAQQILDDDNARLIIPAIVLAEAKHIADRKRVPLAFQQVLEHVTSSANMEIFPMGLAIVKLLPDNQDLHDAIIVATARFCKDFFDEDIAILTNDIAMTELGLVPVIW
jgi:PIN domain nuclease of toxin-antitoxin system